ncbi:uncharacterized protein LOC111265956 isoform X1 [Varroa jacobsoni]|uniref:uncharacterized protein LOC111265956 isoform X1 n=2 Tax=Varroa jacobsoni TaxID=62625 RepID=UPI000BF7E849|nr:uncharacterized protein LOC111265956 isoform X1 [Varroa jacobsoni]XP_022698765.1 uncharacterized protein LOC111265956 isoform X1 [Varroa jacobsoni]XP_022698775.1 uncharacterized protein LOC111265956 isoform X1 [Varroa jacobsoni]XP_022698784.1 uncharacterized protein LOC111265956 isoform X1 [Varroa jacobsoni]
MIFERVKHSDFFASVISLEHMTTARMLTLRKFLHWRALKLLIILSTMAFVTLALLQYQQKLKRPARARWRTVMESSSECVAPVKELGCAVPAFTAEWSTVPSLDIQIYSAHIDDRLVVDGEIQNFIRIIGLLRKSATQVRLYCLANYPSGEQTTARATLDKVWIDSWDNATHKDLLTPYIISCHIGADLQEQPSGVSILTDPCECPSNNLRLRRQMPPPRRDFMVCVKGLFFSRDKSRELMQWLEMLYLLGAKHIHMYNYLLHKKTKKMLKFYQRYRNLTLQKISLPPREYPQGMGFLKNFLVNKAWEKRRLELVPYNDCYYQYKDKFDYITLLDVDELIVPRDLDATSWPTLMHKIRDVEAEAVSKYASFAFSNAYFFRDKDSPMDILVQTQRSANLSRPGFAVKSFFTANGSLAVFNHYTLIPLRPEIRKCAIVGSDIGLVHHYRDSCPQLMEKECENDFMKFVIKDDTVPKKFARRLHQALEAVTHDMKNALF